MVAAGLSVSCSTDNRLMSGVTLSHELQVLHDELGLSHAQLGQMMRNAARASFLPESDREAALQATQRWDEVAAG
jgi:adenosine deaminase